MPTAWIGMPIPSTTETGSPPSVLAPSENSSIPSTRRPWSRSRAAFSARPMSVAFPSGASESGIIGAQDVRSSANVKISSCACCPSVPNGAPFSSCTSASRRLPRPSTRPMLALRSISTTKTGFSLRTVLSVSIGSVSASRSSIKDALRMPKSSLRIHRGLGGLVRR